MNPNFQSPNHDHAANNNAPQTELFVMTAEEMRLLRQCHQEKFLSEGIPLAVISSGTVYWAIKNGKIKPRIFGMFGSVLSAGFAGLFIARGFYTFSCGRKILSMPNSSFRQSMEKVKQQVDQQQHKHENIPQSDNSVPYQQKADDYRPSGSDLDSHPMSSFDPFTSSYNDQPQISDDPVPEPKVQNFSGTYSDLRKQNRKDYIDRMWDVNQPRENAGNNNPNRNYQAPATDNFNRRPLVTQKPEVPFGSARKTKYGDDME